MKYQFIHSYVNEDYGIYVDEDYGIYVDEDYGIYVYEDNYYYQFFTSSQSKSPRAR